MTTVIQQVPQQQMKKSSHQGSRDQTTKATQQRHSPTKSVADLTLPWCAASSPALPTGLLTTIELELPVISTSESKNEMQWVEELQNCI